MSYKSGFTLLEVMVALAVIATAFAAVLALHSDSMEMVISSRISTRAAELAQYKMTEIETIGLENISLTSGDFGDFADGYYWKISTEPAPINHWIKVAVTVSNRNMDEGGSFELTEYIYSEPAVKK